MKPLKNKPNIIVVGAGGVAIQFMGTLMNLLKFRSEHKQVNITIYDKDIFEEKNLDRQIANEKLIGVPKARYLEAMYMPFGIGGFGNCEITITVVEDWFHEGTDVADETSIFCLADNNAAFMACLDHADRNETIEVFRGANEYEGADAMHYHSSYVAHEVRDPRVRFPEIIDDEDGDPIAAENCTGELTESAPQLSVANLEAAAMLGRLVWCQWGEASEISDKNRPVAFSSNAYRTTTHNHS